MVLQLEFTYQFTKCNDCFRCSIAHISRRHIVVARFKQPTNMGENAHEVELFALIMTPSKEKGTKNALETGRTFATMLADYHFRKKLLEAKNETEFKSLMLIKAKQLSGVKLLKNRHKYSVGAAVHHSLNMDLDSKQHHTGEPAGKFVSENSDLNNNGISLQQARAFAKNTHTSKLFELIAQSSVDDSSSKVGKKDSAEISTDLYEVSIGGGTKKEATCFGSLEFGKGLWKDFRRRLAYYPSDFRDAFVGPPKTIHKTVATIWFLYFGILLPTIAFSALNTTQTHGHMGDLRKAIIGQAIGGLGFALLGGQPLVIIMTTAPLCLYTKGSFLTSVSCISPELPN